MFPKDPKYIENIEFLWMIIHYMPYLPMSRLISLGRTIRLICEKLRWTMNWALYVNGQIGNNRAEGAKNASCKSSKTNGVLKLTWQKSQSSWFKGWHHCCRWQCWCWRWCLKERQAPCVKGFKFNPNMHSFRFIHLVVVHHVVVDWSLHQQVLVWQVMRTCNNIQRQS